MKKNLKNGFTLVELLAVIVILAIILVIAVPKVMSVIEDAKKATLESTAKMIASQAEKQKVQNTVLGNDQAITCKDITNINDVDYEDCDITFDNNTAKVTITGSGKFEGLFVCNGTKTESTATKDSCTPVVNAVNFTDDDWATIVRAVKSGNHPYQVGNTKIVDMGSLGTHTIRVSNTTPCDGTLESETACGFVLEFADIITTYNMNPAGEYYGTQYNYGTNLGGWPASAMRTYVNNDIYNALPEALRNGIINTYVVSSYGKDKTTGVVENENAGVLEDGNYWSKDKLYLLSTREVWGKERTSNEITADTADGDAITRQLDYYANYQGDGYTGVSTSKYAGAKKNKSSGSASSWWLRSAASNSDNRFFSVTDNGDWNYYTARSSNGVSPAFRIG